jgi:hypothetical protein
VEWHIHNITMLDEMYSHFPNVSLPPLLPEDASIPNPNERNSDSLRHWLQLCDWYTDVLPHVVLYESVDHLVKRLSSITDKELSEISREIASDNRINWQRQEDQWKQILGKISAAKQSRTMKKSLTD